MPFGKKRHRISARYGSQKRKARYREKKAKLGSNLTFDRPFCTVCKRFQTNEEEINANVYENDDSDVDDFYVPGRNRNKIGTRWTTTQENTPVSGTELSFKLFEILDMEFEVGNVCKDCNHLLEQLDSLQFQFLCLKESLAARVDKFWNHEINYEGCAKHELIARHPDGKYASGESVAKKAIKKIQLGEDQEPLTVDKMTIFSGPPMKGCGRSKALVVIQKDNRQNKKLMSTNTQKYTQSTAEYHSRWTDPRHVEHALLRGNFDNSHIINSNISNPSKCPTLLYKSQGTHMFESLHGRSPSTEMLPVDHMVNRWACAIPNCPVILLTTLDNAYVVSESLYNDKGVPKHHSHPSTFARTIYDNFWGAEITTIVRNHPEQSPKAILDTCRLILFSDDTSSVTTSDQAMTQLISLLKKQTFDF